MLATYTMQMYANSAPNQLWNWSAPGEFTNAFELAVTAPLPHFIIEATNEFENDSECFLRWWEATKTHFEAIIQCIFTFPIDICGAKCVCWQNQKKTNKREREANRCVVTPHPVRHCALVSLFQLPPYFKSRNTVILFHCFEFNDAQALPILQ